MSTLIKWNLLGCVSYEITVDDRGLFSGIARELLGTKSIVVVVVGIVSDENRCTRGSSAFVV